MLTCFYGFLICCNWHVFSALGARHCHFLPWLVSGSPSVVFISSSQIMCEATCNPFPCRLCTGFACRSFLAVQWLQCQCVQGAQYACSPIQQGIYCLCNIFRGEYHVLCVSGEIRQHLLNICLGMRSDMTWYDLTPDCTSRLWVMPPCEWHWTTGTGAQSQGKSFGHFQCTRFLHVNCNTLQYLIVQIQFVLEANDWADKQQRSTVGCQVAHNLALPLSGPETYRGPQLNVGPQACHWTGCDTKSLGSLLH